MRRWVFLSVFFLHAISSWGNEISQLKKYYLSGHKLLQENKFEEAAKKFAELREASTAIQDYVLFDYAQALWSQGKCLDAKAAFSELAAKYPDSRWYEIAEHISRSHEECPPLEIPEPVYEKYDCAKSPSPEAAADCFFDSKRYADAKDIYKKLVLPGKVSERFAKERSSRKQRKKGSRPKSSVQLLVRLSQSAARSQDFETAIEANRLMMLRYPKSPEAHEALKKIAFLHQDAGDYENAISALRQLLRKAKGNPDRREYWGKIAWAQYRLGHYREAIDSYEQAIHYGETSQFLYWKARSIEKYRKDVENPREIYQSILSLYPATYYAVRAAERLDRLGIRTDYRQWWTPLGLSWEEEAKEFPATDDLERIHTLSSLGLMSDAEVEIRLARQHSGDAMWDGLPLPNDPHRFIKKGDRYQFHFRVPRQDVEYRMPYADFLFSEVKRRQDFIDPYLVYAIMRQESRFRTAVVSPVGAIGLLQIMPYTGRKLSKEAGWRAFAPSWLKDPLTNIELSIFYLKKLDALFDGKWYAATASYNAGEAVVSQWMKQRHGWPEEEFIEEIPYGETRDYVRKIYANWKAYRTIYE